MAHIIIKDHGGRLRSDMELMSGVFGEQELVELAMKQIEKLIPNVRLDIFPNDLIGKRHWFILAQGEHGALPIGTVEIIL